MSDADLAAFSRAWTDALAGTGYVPMNWEQRNRLLHGLASRLAAAPFEAAGCYQVGVDLVGAGYASPEALGRTLTIIQRYLPSTVDVTALTESLATGFAHALRDRTLDGQEAIRRASMIAHEQAERAMLAAQAQLRHAALHDPLTDLPNRALFNDRLDLALRSTSGRVGLCLLDLDGFKAVNDSLGHPVGDRLLAAVAGRLTMVAAECDHLLAHFGGGEFALLIEDTNGPDDAVKVADRALSTLNRPFLIDGHELPVSASVGIVERPAAGTDPTDMTRAADITLHWAKADGRARWVLFDSERNRRQVARYRLSAEMPSALRRGEFILEYQPLVDLADGELTGVEALARWRHPRLGVLGPDEFIELAEDTGLIVPLGARLLEEACRQATAWRSLFVSVNVAVLQIHHPGVVAEVVAILDRTGLPPSRLQLEITEGAILLGDATGSLRALADLGVRIVIDDFGTGYANLTYLRTLPIHGLKLAGTFMDGLRHAVPDPTDQSIIATLVSLGQTLGLTVTAEGIETARQARRVHAMGCHTGQGWYFGRPVPPEDINTRIGPS